MQPTKTKKTMIIEISNSVTHGIGAALAIVGLVLLVIKSVQTGSPMRIIAFSVYGSILVLFYLASTMFHSLVFTKAYHLFQVFDHSMIFLLIAGTYTPYCLISIGGWYGWTMFGIIWAMTIAGVVYKSIWLNKVSPISTIIYIIMGWMCLFAGKPLWDALSPVGFYLLLSGGILYTLGALVYLKPTAYSHLIWHFFVLAGSATMYFSILLYV